MSEPVIKNLKPCRYGDIIISAPMQQKIDALRAADVVAGNRFEKKIHENMTRIFRLFDFGVVTDAIEDALGPEPGRARQDPEKYARAKRVAFEGTMERFMRLVDEAGDAFDPMAMRIDDRHTECISLFAKMDELRRDRTGFWRGMSYLPAIEKLLEKGGAIEQLCVRGWRDHEKKTKSEVYAARMEGFFRRSLEPDEFEYCLNHYPEIDNNPLSWQFMVGHEFRSPNFIETVRKGLQAGLSMYEPDQNHRSGAYRTAKLLSEDKWRAVDEQSERKAIFTLLDEHRQHAEAFRDAFKQNPNIDLLTTENIRLLATIDALGPLIDEHHWNAKDASIVMERMSQLPPFFQHRTLHAMSVLEAFATGYEVEAGQHQGTLGVGSQAKTTGGRGDR